MFHCNFPNLQESFLHHSFYMFYVCCLYTFIW
jgi:hypothetical protein